MISFIKLGEASIANIVRSKIKIQKIHRVTSCFSKRSCYSNTLPFIIDTDNMDFFFICSLMARFFCINGTQQYCPERMRGLCKRQLKISEIFHNIIKCLFLGLNFAKVPLFCCSSFSYTFCQIIYFGYLKHEYIKWSQNLRHMVCTTSALIYYQSFTNGVHPMCTSSALRVTLNLVSIVYAI